jgi:hypothetical protein
MMAKWLTGMGRSGMIRGMLTRKNNMRLWLVVAACLMSMAWGAGGVLFCADCTEDIGAGLQKIVEGRQAAMGASSHSQSGQEPANCMDCRDLTRLVMRARHSNGGKSPASQGIAVVLMQTSLCDRTNIATHQNNMQDAGGKRSEELRSVVLLI